MKEPHTHHVDAPTRSLAFSPTCRLLPPRFLLVPVPGPQILRSPVPPRGGHGPTPCACWERDSWGRRAILSKVHSHPRARNGLHAAGQGAGWGRATW